MGVYIPNMEMPTSCRACPLATRFFDGEDVCAMLGTYVHDRDREDDCPLVPVPPHYDLIDHNALKIAVMDCDAETRIDFLKHTMDCINKAPVVIPSDMPTYEAEEGE